MTFGTYRQHTLGNINHSNISVSISTE